MLIFYVYIWTRIILKYPMSQLFEVAVAGGDDEGEVEAGGWR